MAQSQPSRTAHLLTLAAVPETFPKADFHPKGRSPRIGSLMVMRRSARLALPRTAGTRVLTQFIEL